MSDLLQRFQSVRHRIAAAGARCDRVPGSVHLIAVGKTHPAAAIRELAGAGQGVFGESFVAEALAKQQCLADLKLEWHFIGHIQGNKCRSIAASFDWVHSLDRVRIATRLAALRDTAHGPLNVLIQVNIDQEASKFGVAPNRIEPLAAAIAVLPRLKLRGLMAIPAPTHDFDRQRRGFAALREAQARLNGNGYRLDCLSMGMTDDLAAAIAEGATHVRVGTAIFGPRQYTERA